MTLFSRKRRVKPNEIRAYSELIYRGAYDCSSFCFDEIEEAGRTIILYEHVILFLHLIDRCAPADVDQVKLLTTLAFGVNQIVHEQMQEHAEHGYFSIDDFDSLLSSIVSELSAYTFAGANLKSDIMRYEAKKIAEFLGHKDDAAVIISQEMRLHNAINMIGPSAIGAAFIGKIA